MNLVKSSAEIVEEVKKEIPEVSVDEVKAKQDQGEDFVLLDEVDATIDQLLDHFEQDIGTDAGLRLDDTSQ